ncbi:MAG TPA: hypothetical protein VL098_11800 [Flavipsychrobacter sp.]|nr:hypothetical protein [Flavipsychrobacter sp.]
MKLKLVLAFVFSVFIYIIFNLNFWRDGKTLYWDKSGYYVYLPATFIYNDIGRLDFLDSLNPKYRLTGKYNDYGLFEQPTGKRLNKYSIGLSFFQLPFFAIGHLITVTWNEYPADGYSPYYMLLICISTAFWTIMGLWVLGKFLRRHVSTAITISILLLLAFGTNLYTYSSFDTGMSHTCSFFLMACVLNLTDNWYRSERKKWVVLLGFVFGWIFLVRPVNIICLLIPLLWQTETERLGNRPSFFFKNRSGIALAGVLGIGVAFIQLAYWKYVTGNWLTYSYQGEYFNFVQPYILDGLFSYRKGWFVYTPLALIASLGFFFRKRKYTSVLPALLSTMCVAVYVVFSWECWYYGGSFGCRALIEFLAVMAYPLAVFIEYCSSKGNLAKITLSSVLVAMLLVNIWQTYQFHKGVIRYDNMTGAYYWRVFFKTSYTPADEALLDE